MGIFSRLADIINSNIGATLDRAENPEKMVRMMIQEMEDTLVEVRVNAAKAIADKKEVARKRSRIQEARESWQRKAEIALSKDREDLARGALVEKNKLEEVRKAMDEELEHLGEAIDKHEEDVLKLEAKLREVKAKQQAIVARTETAVSRIKVRERVNDTRLSTAFKRFEQMERRLDDTEGRIESFDLGRGKTLAEEIADLEVENGIEEELATMRERLRKRAEVQNDGEH